MCAVEALNCIISKLAAELELRLELRLRLRLGLGLGLSLTHSLSHSQCVSVSVSWWPDTRDCEMESELPYLLLYSEILSYFRISFFALTQFSFRTIESAHLSPHILTLHIQIDRYICK